MNGDDALASEVRSYLSRGLRSLGDVEIVSDSEAFYRLGIILLPLTGRDGVKTGYVVSVIVVQPTGYDALRPLFKGATSEDALKALDAVLKESVNVVDHFVQVGGSDDVEKICKTVVATFDGDVLESERKINQQMKDKLNR